MSAFPTRRPDALLLDAGNTVVFVAHDVIAQILVGAGHDVDAAALRSTQREASRRYTNALHTGARQQDSWHNMMRSWVELVGVPPERSDEAVKLLREHHDELNLWRCVPAGLPEALARARDAGVLVGIVSNSEGRLAQLFERVGLGAAFDVVVDSGLEGVHKPAPEIFWRACKRLRVAPQRCIYAGDLPDVDVLGAHRAGLDAVLVDPFDEHADYRAAPRFPSVVALVQALLQL